MQRRDGCREGNGLRERYRKAERLGRESFNTEDKKRRFHSTRFCKAYSFQDIGIVEPI